jgi:sterol desaturase/sphingolipid hydroxylase (fatty acid hydroxylase superfamily)
MPLSGFMPSDSAIRTKEFPDEQVSPDRFRLSSLGAVAVIVVSATVAIAAMVGAGYIHSSPGGGATLRGMLTPWELVKYASSEIFVAARSPAPVLLLALILERWRPVSPTQRDLTRGFAQDLAWYAADYLRLFSWVVLFLALLPAIKARLIGNFELVPTGILPTPIAWVAAILAGDLLSYLSHLTRHRIDFLWRFHAIHHSQQEMNFFTQHRFHDLDVVADLGMRMLPLVLLNASWLSLGIFNAIALLHFHLYHSNIRIDYGPLRYVLVTPQSHRVHHARDYRQHNSNFGIVFSIWDRLFGTQYGSHVEYPEALGIADERFPIEQGTRLLDIPRVYAAQVAYPFAGILTRKNQQAQQKDFATGDSGTPAIQDLPA